MPVLPKTIIYPYTIYFTDFQRPQQILSAFADFGFISVFGDIQQSCKVKEGFFRSKGWGEFLNQPSVIYITYPHHIEYYDEVFKKKCADTIIWYDIIDELELFEQSGNRPMKEFHDRLLNEAAVVTTSAKSLQEKTLPFRPDSICIPNACDYELFSKRPHEVYKTKYRALIGYYGAMAPWVDWELVEMILATFPDYELIMIGREYQMQDTVKRLNDKYPNLTITGHVEYKTLPYYLYGFDVAIIPFQINDITLVTSPIKLYEYMASGVPCVTTPMPEAKLPGVLWPQSKNGFIKAINALVCGYDRDKNERMNYVKKHTWHSRVADVLAQAWKHFYYLQEYDIALDGDQTARMDVTPKQRKTSMQSLWLNP